MAEKLNVQSWYDNFGCSFTSTDTTTAKILVDVQGPGLLNTITGEIAPPFSATANYNSVLQRPLTGGFRGLWGSGARVVSTATAIQNMDVFKGRLMSTSTDALWSTSSGNLLQRDVGSFITDGWRLSDGFFGFGATGISGVDGLYGVVTAVAATTLTFSGTPITTSTLLPSGFRAIRAEQIGIINIPANAGTASGIPSVAMFGGTQDPALSALPNTGDQFGYKSLLIVRMTSTVTSIAPKQVQCNVPVALY